MKKHLKDLTRQQISTVDEANTSYELAAIIFLPDATYAVNNIFDPIN